MKRESNLCNKQTSKINWHFVAIMLLQIISLKIYFLSFKMAATYNAIF